MTEKEVFLNMIHRVSAENSIKEDLKNFYYEDNNNVVIINGNFEETVFYFDENGSLSFYE